MSIDEDLRELSKLTADELVAQTEVEIARELVRRARRAERVEGEVRRWRRTA